MTSTSNPQITQELKLKIMKALKDQVFDSVDQGTMKPAGLERKIEHQMVPSGGGGKAYERIVPTATSNGVGGGIFGAFGGGATAAFGAVSPSPAQPFGGVQQQQQQQQQTSFGGC